MAGVSGYDGGFHRGLGHATECDGAFAVGYFIVCKDHMFQLDGYIIRTMCIVDHIPMIKVLKCAPGDYPRIPYVFPIEGFPIRAVITISV